HLEGRREKNLDVVMLLERERPRRIVGARAWDGARRSLIEKRLSPRAACHSEERNQDGRDLPHLPSSTTSTRPAPAPPARHRFFEATNSRRISCPAEPSSRARASTS